MAEYIDKTLLLSDIDAAVNNNGMGYVIGQTLKRYVKRQPSADVAPVVHGKWVEKRCPITWGDSDLDVYTVCSVCGCCSPGDTKYCPNCGAKMNLGEPIFPVF